MFYCSSLLLLVTRVLYFVLMAICVDLYMYPCQVTTFQAGIKSGNKPADQEMIGVSEMLMRQLLKLDSIEADGDAKALRRTEVCLIPGVGLRGLLL